VSFRKKHRKAQTEAKEEDVKVVKEGKGQDKSASDSSQDQAQTQQTTGQQSGQESGQPPAQNDAQSDDKSSGDEDDDDKSDEAEPVPAGTTAEILRWVGDDKERAQAALDKEQGEDKPRGGLTGELKKILEK
jgi:hypothetical protein